MAQLGIGTRIFILFLLIIALLVGGIFWFHYLGVFDAEQAFAPVLGLFGEAPESIQADDPLLLDTIRLRRQEEALQNQYTQLANKEADVSAQEQDFEQRLAELDEREKAQDEREETFNDRVRRYDDREQNIRQNVQYLNSMTPDQAVTILYSYEDQLLIDTLRSAEEIAAESGAVSLVSVWLGKMSDLEKAKDPSGQTNRVAEIQRLMALKPPKDAQ